MKTTITGVFATALAFSSVAQAHMQLSYPAPYRAKNNPNAGSNIDYSMTAPLTGAAQFPCKGYHSDFGTPAGASVATWPAGSTTKFSVEGGAPHGGGSCQASLSYDKGATFTVVASFIGSCPLSSGAEFPFTVPSDAPAGEAIFAWTWFNKIGNREIYMNCATVTISGGVGKARRSDTAFSARPQVFQANLGGSCASVEGKEVVFPNPGPDVVDKQQPHNEDSIIGCGAASGGSGSSGGGAATSAGPQTPTGGVFVPVPTSSTVVAPEPTTQTDAPEPTTLATVVSSVASATTTEAASSIIPVATATATADTPAPTTGSAGAQTGACSPEGLWNCIGGTSFQQCASGSWSVVMQVAAGTKCTPGQSAVIDISAA